MDPGVVNIDDDIDIIIVVNKEGGRGHSRG